MTTNFPPVFFEEPFDSSTATVGETIRALRLASRNNGAGPVSQFELAEHMHVSQAYLSLVESGRRRLQDLGQVNAICEFLALPPEYSELLVSKWKAESASPARRRALRLSRSPDELVPGIRLDALRTLLDTNPTARAAVLAWLARMRTRIPELPTATTPSEAPTQKGAKAKRGHR